jgi:hypothetical protein
MAKEERKHEGGKGEEKKAPKKHLHQIRSVQAEDGTVVHHHTYKAKREDHHTEPERENVATSQDAGEAGQHVEEQFGMNEQEPDQGAQEVASQPGQQPGGAVGGDEAAPNV